MWYSGSTIRSRQINFIVNDIEIEVTEKGRKMTLHDNSNSLTTGNEKKHVLDKVHIKKESSDCSSKLISDCASVEDTDTMKCAKSSQFDNVEKYLPNKMISNLEKSINDDTNNACSQKQHEIAEKRRETALSELSNNITTGNEDKHILKKMRIKKEPSDCNSKLISDSCASVEDTETLKHMKSSQFDNVEKSLSNRIFNLGKSINDVTNNECSQKQHEITEKRRKMALSERSNNITTGIEEKHILKKMCIKKEPSDCNSKLISDSCASVEDTETLKHMKSSQFDNVEKSLPNKMISNLGKLINDDTNNECSQKQHEITEKRRKMALYERSNDITSGIEKKLILKKMCMKKEPSDCNSKLVYASSASVEDTEIMKHVKSSQFNNVEKSLSDKIISNLAKSINDDTNNECSQKQQILRSEVKAENTENCTGAVDVVKVSQRTALQSKEINLRTNSRFDSSNKHSKNESSNNGLGLNAFEEGEIVDIPEYLEEEREDLYDPGWETVKGLNTYEKRFQHVKKCWCSTISNPNKNLTYHSFRKRHFVSDVRVQTRHKRLASSTLMPQRAKRSRTCTVTLDEKIEGLIEKEKEEVKYLKTRLKEGLDRIEKKRSEMKIQTSEGFKDNASSKSRQWNSLNKYKNNYEFDYKKLIKNCHANYDSKINKLRESRTEVYQFNKFYDGIDPLVGDFTFLTEDQVDELKSIDKVYEQMEKYYR